MLTFNSIDVETANADRASICQIGIVHVREGIIEDQWKTLINPEDWFDPWNESIHGINETDVKIALFSQRFAPSYVLDCGGLFSSAILRSTVLHLNVQ